MLSDHKMTMATPPRLLLSLALSLCLIGCGGSGTSTTTAPVQVTPPVSPPPPPPPAAISAAFKTQSATVRFLSKATFGATQSQINTLSGTEVSQWLVSEFNKPAFDYSAAVRTKLASLPVAEQLFSNYVVDSFMNNAIAGNDQLRARIVLALSEMIVVSSTGQLDDAPRMMADYIDILGANAFGNFRDLLNDITYSPAMGRYLTYLANEKGDPSTGRVPDENYARELLQLFTLGLVELNLDGTQTKDTNGDVIEIYTNEDITGLARVFTGFSVENSLFHHIFRDRNSWFDAMIIFPEYHSNLEKTFLGTTIPANTAGDQSIKTALDTIFAHKNIAPFVSRQLIQRLVTSHPKPEYVQRVASAFEAGRYNLPDGTIVGTGQRGDMRALISAVLLDANAVRTPDITPADFGKVSEPMIRFFQWARAFGETNPDVADEYNLENLSRDLGQHPFGSPSVFNFFRPGYIAPNTKTGTQSLTMPELQIVNESTAIGYINFINSFIYGWSANRSGSIVAGVTPDYAVIENLASDPTALVDKLDLILTGNQLHAATKTRIIALLAEIPDQNGTDNSGAFSRLAVATSMVMTAPETMVQK